jgi:hypothetical protein
MIKGRAGRAVRVNWLSGKVPSFKKLTSRLSEFKGIFRTFRGNHFSHIITFAITYDAVADLSRENPYKPVSHHPITPSSLIHDPPFSRALPILRISYSPAKMIASPNYQISTTPPALGTNAEFERRPIHPLPSQRPPEAHS